MILDVGIIEVSKTANRFEVKKSRDRDHATLCFDYLDKGDGAIIQVFHTGKGEHDLFVHGTIKGAGHPVKEYIVPKLTGSHRSGAYFQLAIWGGLLILAVYEYIFGEIARDAFKSPQFKLVSIFLFALTFCVFALIAFQPSARKTPKHFRSFIDPFYGEQATKG